MKKIFFIFTVAVTFISIKPSQAARVSGPFAGDVEACQQYRLCIHVNKRTQSMSAYLNVDGIPTMLGPVTNDSHEPRLISTARAGKTTPVGTFSIGEIAGRWRVSTLYSGAALYYALQIVGNIFIHATSADNYQFFGEEASAGCIRTDLVTAEFLNALVRDVGRTDTRVVVTNRPL